MFTVVSVIHNLYTYSYYASSVWCTLYTVGRAVHSVTQHCTHTRARPISTLFTSIYTVSLRVGVIGADDVMSLIIDVNLAFSYVNVVR